jgi:hypothetical protein
MTRINIGQLTEVLKRLRHYADPTWCQRELKKYRNWAKNPDSAEEAQGWRETAETWERMNRGNPRGLVMAGLQEALHRGRNDENGPRLPARWLPRLITLCHHAAEAQEYIAAEALGLARTGGVGKTSEEWEGVARKARARAQHCQTAAAVVTWAVHNAATWLPEVPGATGEGLRLFAVRGRHRGEHIEEKVKKTRARLALLEQEENLHYLLAEQAKEAAGKMDGG